jgi:hypothetical protein
MSRENALKMNWIPSRPMCWTTAGTLVLATSMKVVWVRRGADKPDLPSCKLVADGLFYSR